MLILSGSNSVLANHMLPLLRDQQQVCAFDADRGDIRDTAFLSNLIGEMKPDLFLNFNQFDNIEECEYKREEAYKINAFASGNLAKLCREHNIYLVHLSSSYVFDGGQEAPYREDDTPNPLSVYGDSRLLGERFIEDSGCRHLILRLPDVFGRGRSFLHEWFSQMRTEGNARVIRDQVLSPTYAQDAAFAVQELINRRLEGVYHFANGGTVTAAEFLREAVRLYQQTSRQSLPNEIRELDYEDYLSPADRPLCNALDNSKYRQSTGAAVRDWKSALDEFLRDFNNEI